MSTTVTKELLPCVEIKARGPALGTVLWLHGLGADGHDFEDIVPHLEQPCLRFMFPHAPKRPITLNFGMVMRAWYDIASLDEGERREDEAGIRDSMSHIQALIEREEARGVPPERLVLAGFSQGGAMALVTGTRYPKRLAGLIVLSAYEVLSSSRQAEQQDANRDCPILFCHGSLDPLVNPALGRRAYEAFSGPHRQTEHHEFPIGHSVSMPEIQVIRDWLAKRFNERA